MRTIGAVCSMPRLSSAACRSGLSFPVLRSFPQITPGEQSVAKRHTVLMSALLAAGGNLETNVPRRQISGSLRRAIRQASGVLNLAVNGSTENSKNNIERLLRLRTIGNGGRYAQIGSA